MSEFAGDVRRGLGWTALNRLTVRLGSFGVGIVLARILAPEEFGVYAIALTTQVIVINLAELGLAADLVRNGDFARRAPTIMSLALISAVALTAVMALSAPWVATTMGSSDAAHVIELMSLTILLAGVGAVPYARLQRDFRQRALFGIDLATFVVSTVLTIGLAVAGVGALSLAIGRVAAQLVATGCQFWVSRQPVRLGWRPDVVRSGLRFGFPFACAGLLSLTLLNVDNMLVGHSSGAAMLGVYVLAFNMASWPTTTIGSSIRAVAMPAFARVQNDDEVVSKASGLAWAVALPMSAGLGIFAQPLIDLVYGTRWSAAAGPLVGLAILGGLRVVFEVWVAFLTARGAAGTLLWIQGSWIVALAPTLYLAVGAYGLPGAGWAHAAVAGLLMVPVHLLGIARAGARWQSVITPAAVPVASIVVAAPLAWLARSSLSGTGAPDLVILLAGGVVLVTTYGLLVRHWFLAQLAWFRVLAEHPAAEQQGTAILVEETTR